MMKHYLFFFHLVLFILVAAGCGQLKPETKEQQNQPTPARLDITFQSSPDHPGKNQPVELSSVITSENKPFPDANVEFEVWKQGKEHQTFKATHQADGTYTAVQKFPEDGEYHVVVHVTAPGIHQMTSGSFTVGSVQNDSHAHHDSGVQMHLAIPDHVRAGQTIEASAHIQRDQKALSGANVRLEVWKQGNEQHKFVEASEKKPGEYTASLSFPEKGTYHLKLHVEKEKIHDHQEKTVTVQ
jgi:hypothetical protein